MRLPNLATLALAIAITVVCGCGKQQPSDKPESAANTSAASTATPAVPAATSPASSRPPIEGLKEFRLGMTLEELKRLRTLEVNGSAIPCGADYPAYLCEDENQTLAGVPATVSMTFLATAPITEPKYLPVPRRYEISQQNVRLGLGEEEAAKEQANYNERKRIAAANQEAELKSLSQFTLAEMLASFRRDKFNVVRQALLDRYGTPDVDIRDHMLVKWEADSATLTLFECQTGEGCVSVQSNLMVPFIDQYREQLRRQRAGDL